MHFNAFWHINTHHQILTSTEIRPIFSFPPHFSNLCMKIVPPLFCEGSRLRPGVYGVDAPVSSKEASDSQTNRTFATDSFSWAIHWH